MSWERAVTPKGPIHLEAGDLYLGYIGGYYTRPEGGRFVRSADIDNSTPLDSTSYVADDAAPQHREAILILCSRFSEEELAMVGSPHNRADYTYKLMIATSAGKVGWIWSTYLEERGFQKISSGKVMA